MSASRHCSMLARVIIITGISTLILIISVDSKSYELFVIAFMKKFKYSIIIIDLYTTESLLILFLCTTYRMSNVPFSTPTEIQISCFEKLLQILYYKFKYIYTKFITEDRYRQGVLDRVRIFLIIYFTL